MSLKPKHINRQIDRYYSGDLTGAEMHELEKQALSDPFLKDAMDGYATAYGSIAYYNNKLQNRFKGKYKYWAITILSFALIVMTGLYFTKSETIANQAMTDNRAIKNIEEEYAENLSEIEVIPHAIETLSDIETKEQIKTTIVKHDFSSNDTYHAESKEKNDNIVLVNPNDLLIDEELPQIVVAKRAHKKVVYPYRYYYDLAVVDYSRFENREKNINKTIYVLSGVDASFESENAKNSQELVEQTVQVSYLSYLEETMYYFSKDRYKNALKRLNIISNHYKNDLNALFYGGLCYYNLGDFSTALAEFNSVISLKAGPFTEEAMWYKAKTLIKLKRHQEAKDLLAEIILGGGFYTDQAAELLKNL
ncbi:MAG: CDC27 family protein [Putridiphycobacter sp.]|nr:CDC27 family protein [Putridiphycobacter sp.]